MNMDEDSVASSNSGGSTDSSSAAEAMTNAAAAVSGDVGVSGSDGVGSTTKINKGKRTSVTSNNEAAEAPGARTPPADGTLATAGTSAAADDAGSSRLFQPHRSLGLLTAAASYAPASRLFRSQQGKFHLQPQARSSDDAFVTVPLGERFQIVAVSKLVPVLVSRALPPSAGHHRPRTGTGGGATGGGGVEEEMHRAVSDSSLSITVATHGPRATGRAVSMTLYSRTRPVVWRGAR